MRMNAKSVSAWIAALAMGLGSNVAAAAKASTPDDAALLGASGNDNQWILPAKNYEGNPYTKLTQIAPNNVASLSLAWSTALADEGQQEAAALSWNGTLFVATAHNGVVALDAVSGKLKWQFPYDPSYIISFSVNRGVGIADGKVFMATLDCRVIALDAETGKQVWNVAGCSDTSNSFYSMAAYVYRGAVIVGHAGGDYGTEGSVTAFSTQDGKQLWDWSTIKRDTWPGTSWHHGGAAVWSGISIDPKDSTLFVAPGNPGPDMVLKGREGPDLYSNSLVALDINGTKPKVKWHYQLVKNDTHDADAAMIPVLFTAKVAGKMQDLVAIGDKAGDFVVLDRKSGKPLHKLAVSDQTGFFTTVPTVEGTHACPNHGGGIEWLGGGYDPASNLFFVPSTEECGIWKIDANPPVYAPGQGYKGGALPKRGNGTGVLTAIDMDTGAVRWRKPLPFPGQGGALITASGLVFTSDLGGSLYAFSTTTGEQLWHVDTGSAVVAPITTYVVGGQQYLNVVVGQAGNQQTANLPTPQASRVLAFRLGATQPAVNSTEGQVARATSKNAAAGEVAESIGDAPYTAEQVTAGAAVYAQHCAVCHGAQLQGVAAPAMAGPAFARTKPTLAQLHTVVTKNMPLTAPGTLAAADYAAIMAYMLSYECVKPSGEGKTPFPTGDISALKPITFGAKVCPPGSGKE
jgi:alcohol dehydrogenase (cytochrome c)